MDEAVAIYDWYVLELGHIVSLLLHHVHGTSKVWPKSGSAFRKLFNNCIKHFQLESLEPETL